MKSYSQDSSFTFQNNDYVNIASSPSLQMSTGMTIECWVNPALSEYSDYSSLVHYFRLGGPEQESGFTLQYFEGQLRFMISVGSGNYDIVGDGLQVWPGITLTQDSWTHVAGTYDVATGKAKIFKNGIEQANFDTEGGNINWDFIETIDMKIGKSELNPGGTDGYFNGGIDEIRLWDSAFEPEALQSVMCNSPIGNSGLVGYWNFNDAGGGTTTISDVTGNGNDGNLVIAGGGYWDDDVYGNNDICTGSGACVDSVISSLPFYHESSLDESMGDDWSFQDYPHGADYAYEITLSTARNLYVDTCDPLTDFDTILSIKDECGNDVSIIEFDDGLEDFCPESGIPDNPWYASIIDSVTLEAGTYYIILDGWSGNVGNYKIVVGTLPEIIDSDIASDDSYIDIYFSEGMYTEATASGAVVESDFTISIDGGIATGVNIQYLSNISGGALVGGEEIVRFFIDIEGESSGEEQITIHTQTNASIFNSFGIGLLSSATVTQGLSDQIAPILQSSIPVDGSVGVTISSNVVLEFSEPIFNNNGEVIDNSNSQNSILLKNTNNGTNINYTISTSNNENFTIDPDTTLPDFANVQVLCFNIQDSNGNAFQSDTIQFQTADESPPLLQTSGLASTNLYVFLDFTEGVYSEDSGTGPVGMDDITHFFDNNDGSCTSVSIIEITNQVGGTLTGGESSIRAYLDLNAAPSGSETIKIAPADGSSIFDQAGNPMHPSNETAEHVFNASARIDTFTLHADNEYVDIIFSDWVYGNSSQTLPIEITDLSIAFNSNLGNATSIMITELTSPDTSDLSGGEDIIRVFLDLDTLASGVETIIISPSENDRIYNFAGVLVPQAENTGLITLNDKLPPAGSSDIEDGAVGIDEENAISMNFTDNLYINDSNGNFIELQENPSILEFPDSPFITLLDGAGNEIEYIVEIDGDPDQIRIIPQDPYVSEDEVSFSFNGEIMDENGNVIDFDFEASFSIRDYIPPTVLEMELDPISNAYIDIYFDDQIYGTDSTFGAIGIDDIEAIITNPGNSLVNTCIVTSLNKLDNNFLIGGENVVRATLDYNNTPEGNEEMRLRATVNTSIFDESGNMFSSPFGFFADTTIRLHDILRPTITALSVPIDSSIRLMTDKLIVFDFNEKVVSMNLTVNSPVIGPLTFRDSLIKSDSAIVVELQTPFASYDSITINFANLEDQAGNQNVDIAYTYPTQMLGDYDLDSKITYDDLMDLVSAWELEPPDTFQDLSYQLAPVTGTAPHFISIPDDSYNIDDGMAFFRMWSWYQQTFGEITEDTSLTGRPLSFLFDGNNLSILLSDTITAGQIQFSYKMGHSPIDFINQVNKNGEFFMNRHFPEKGYSICEFARAGELQEDTIKVNIKESSKIRIAYKFSSHNINNVQKGSVNINHSSLPNSVALHPPYPNPFNPLTTIRFDIPDLNIPNSVALLIFDIKGRQIETLINGMILPGSYSMQWDASDYASGVYFSRLVYGTYVKTQKIILLK